MGRRRTVWCYKTHQRYIKEGRGTGDKESYIPWISVHDFPSKGKVVRIVGRKTGRIHHLMSQLEKDYFLILDNTPEVTDIKEQYPIPVGLTLHIAAEMGIKHPEVNGYPVVMTTDFFYCSNNEWHAVQVKAAANLEDPRVLEKFAIEKEYYRRIRTDWKVVTENDISTEMADNYAWLNAGESIYKLIPDVETSEWMIDSFIELYSDRTIPFHDIIREMDSQCGVREGTSLQVFKHLVKKGIITLDLSRPINIHDPRIPHVRQERRNRYEY